MCIRDRGVGELEREIQEFHRSPGEGGGGPRRHHRDQRPGSPEAFAGGGTDACPARSQRVEEPRRGLLVRAL
eukprot:4164300-Alexandrium_andersonii.AAC.1